MTERKARQQPDADPCERMNKGDEEGKASFVESVSR
jgi:hypothetical protein